MFYNLFLDFFPSTTTTTCVSNWQFVNVAGSLHNEGMEFALLWYKQLFALKHCALSKIKQSIILARDNSWNLAMINEIDLVQSQAAEDMLRQLILFLGLHFER